MTAQSTPPAAEPAPPEVRILLVDDHVVMRAGLRMLIESQPGFRIIAEAGDGTLAVQLAEKERPDIILLDLDLGQEKGLDFLSRCSK
jgi:DNA-binding NarL/FixJ family response regulator